MANPLLNVTDYSKKWVEGYQRNTQQLARYHDQLTLRDQQEEKAKTAVTTPKVLAQIDQTLGSTLQFATARDELKRDKIFQKLDKLGVDGDATSLLMLMDKHGKDIVNQEKDYNNYLNLIKKMPTGTVDYLKSLHGRNLYWAKAYSAKKTAESIGLKYKNLLAYDGDDEVIKKEKADLVSYLEKHQDDPIAKKAALRRWASSQFGDEYLSDKILSEYVMPDVDKWLTTDDLLSQHETAKISLGREDQDFSNRYSIVAKDTTKSQLFFKNEISNVEASLDDNKIEITETGVIINGVQQVSGNFIKEDGKLNKRAIARQITLDRLIKVAHADGTTRIDLDRLMAPGGAEGSPQGDSIKFFFTEDELKPVYHAFNQATERAVLRAEAAKEAANEDLITKGMSEFTGENWSQPAWTNIYNKLMLNGGTEKQLKKAEFMMNNTDSEASYNDATKDFESEMKVDVNGDLVPVGGFLTTDRDIIDAIPNITYRTQAQATQDKYLPTFERAGTKKLIEADIQTYLKGIGITFDPNAGFAGEAAWVEKDLTNYANRMAVIGMNKGFTGEDLNNFVSGALNKYWTDNGGGRKTSTLKDQDKWGKFTTNENNQFKRHRDQRVDAFTNKLKKEENLIKKAESFSKPLDELALKNIRSNLELQFVEAGGFKNPNAVKDIMSTPNSCVTFEDFQVMVKSGSYSQKLLAQAEVLQVSPGELFEAQYYALQESIKDDTKARAKLESILGGETLKVPEDEKKFYEAIKDNPYLTNIFKTGKYKFAQLRQKKRIAFAFLNDDFTQAPLVWPGGIPMKIGFENYGLSIYGTPRTEVTEDQITSYEALEALEDK